MMHLLYIGEAPIQNVRPYRLMQELKGLSMEVLYTGTGSAFEERSHEQLTKAAFDHDLLSGYPSIMAHGQWAIVKAAVNRADVLVIYGHHQSLFRKAMWYARWKGKKVILTNDATYPEGTAQSSGWKLKLKPLLFRCLYHYLAEAVLVPSTAAALYLRSLGIRIERIVITPYVVDEEFITTESEHTNREVLREEWKAIPGATVFIFCAKWIERKRPLDVLEAFALARDAHSRLVLIGDGPLKPAILEKIQQLGLEESVLLPGLVKYSDLPGYYTSADVLVFSSSHEPYGLPVNEAMLCGIPVIVSDRIGARLDLVEQGNTGWVYETGNVNAMAQWMRYAIEHKEEVRQMGKAAKAKMRAWSSEVNVQRQLDFFKARGWME